MPIHPYDPYGDDPEEEDAPDIGDVVDRILNGGDGPAGLVARS